MVARANSLSFDSPHDGTGTSRQRRYASKNSQMHSKKQQLTSPPIGQTLLGLEPQMII